MREADLRVVAAGGKHEVRTVAGDVLATCDSSAQAWRWIDRHSSEGQQDDTRHYRIQQSGKFS